MNTTHVHHVNDELAIEAAETGEHGTHVRRRPSIVLSWRINPGGLTANWRLDR